MLDKTGRKLLILSEKFVFKPFGPFAMLVYARKIIYENIVAQRLAAVFITFPPFNVHIAVVYPSSSLYYCIIICCLLFSATNMRARKQFSALTTAAKSPFKIDATWQYEWRKFSADLLMVKVQIETDDDMKKVDGKLLGFVGNVGCLLWRSLGLWNFCSTKFEGIDTYWNVIEKIFFMSQITAKTEPIKWWQCWDVYWKNFCNHLNLMFIDILK